jgi:hypothetical protein
MSQCCKSSKAACFACRPARMYTCDLPAAKISSGQAFFSRSLCSLFFCLHLRARAPLVAARLNKCNCDSLGFFSLVYPTGHPGNGLHRRSDCSRAAAGPVWASRRRAYMNTWTMIRVSPWQDPVPPEALFLF